MIESANSNRKIADSSQDPSGLTRRQWLLRLGEAAVLAGWAGIPPEEPGADGLSASPAAVSRLTSDPTPQPALPPGLYDPSADQLTHALMREQRFVTPPPGSETEYAQPRLQPFAPTFFSPEEFRVVRQLVRLMLNGPGEEVSPGEAASAETIDEVAQWIDFVVSRSVSVREAAHRLSPQHRALAVRYYGEEVVRELETSDPPEVWKDGLAWLGEESARLSSQDFLSLAESQQATVLQRLAQSGGEAQRGPNVSGSGPRLYRLLKHQVIEGFYTSQAGLKELDYQGNAFHGESPGCPRR
jgi:Gluconate 2-dehydrogenase subunit 3